MTTREAGLSPSLPYSKGLIRALASAEKDALKFGGGYCSTGALLSGLSREKSVKKIFNGFGITTNVVLHSNMPPFQKKVQNPPDKSRHANLSERARRALGLADQEAISTGALKITPIHAVIGILLEGKGTAVPIMEKLSGKTPDKLLAELRAAA